MKVSACVSLVFGVILAGCSDKQSAISSAPSTNTSAGSPVAPSSPTEPNAPVAAPVQAAGPIGNPLNTPGGYVGGLSDSQRTAVRVLDTASINQAIQMFYAEEDRYPRNLDELIEKKYFARLPDPPRGMRYQYNPNTGQMRVVDE